MKPRRVRVRLAIAGLGSALALGIELHAAAASPDPPRKQGAPLIYQKSRSFRVPFHFDPAERARRRELQLWVSDDMGRTWAHQQDTTPDRPAFEFRCEQDGEFWLAVRTVDIQGRLHPADDSRIEPSMKVIVDTTPPSVVLEKQVRSASLASVRWETRDDYPDQKPPVLEFQVEGSKEWRPVPNDGSGTLGVVTWDSGYAEPLKVRATIVDRAGNRGQTILDLPSSSPAAPGLASMDPTPPRNPTPAEPRSGAEKAPRPSPFAANTVGPPAGLPPAETKARNRGILDQVPVPIPSADRPQPAVASVEPPPGEAPGRPNSVPGHSTNALPIDVASRSPAPAVTPDRNMPQSPAAADPRDLPADRVVPSATDPEVGLTRMVAEPGRPAAAAPAAEIPTLKVQSLGFSLDYAIDHAGPDGRPAVVELWVTADGGKTWSRRGKDTDRVSPVQVELEGEGKFGLSLIARDSKGLGDKVPAPGEPPQMWVEVAPKPEAARRPGSFLQRAFRR